MMRQQIASVDDWVTEGLVRIIDAHLRTDAPAHALGCALLHLLEVREVVLNAVVAMARCDAVPAFLPHLLLHSVVRVCLALLDESDCKLVQVVEVVGRVRDSVAMDVKQCEVLEDGLLKLGLTDTVKSRPRIDAIQATRLPAPSWGWYHRNE